MLIDALREDMRRMDEISSDCGLHMAGPYKNDERTEQYMWAFAVALLHIITLILKKDSQGA